MFLSIWRFFQALFASNSRSQTKPTNHDVIIVLEIFRPDEYGKSLCGACHALINMRNELEATGKFLRGQDAQIHLSFLELIQTQLTQLYAILRSGDVTGDFATKESLRKLLNDYRLAYAAAEIKPSNDDHLWYVRELQSLTYVPAQLRRP